MTRATVPVLGDFCLGHKGHKEPLVLTATLDTLEERERLVMVVHLAIMVFKDLLAQLGRGVGLVVKEKRGHHIIPTWVWE